MQGAFAGHSGRGRELGKEPRELGRGPCRSKVRRCAKARRGEIANMTGIQDPHEAPGRSDIVIDTEKGTPDESGAELVEKLTSLGLLGLGPAGPS